MYVVGNNRAYTHALISFPQKKLLHTPNCCKDPGSHGIFGIWGHSMDSHLGLNATTSYDPDIVLTYPMYTSKHVETSRVPYAKGPYNSPSTKAPRLPTWTLIDSWDLVPAHNWACNPTSNWGYLYEQLHNPVSIQVESGSQDARPPKVPKGPQMVLVSLGRLPCLG